VFWVISVYFNIRNTLPKYYTFLPGQPVYYRIKELCIKLVNKNKFACGVCISVCPFQVIFICFVGTHLMDVFKQNYLLISLLCYSVCIINFSWKKIMCLAYDWSIVFGCNLNNCAVKNVYFPTWSDSM
jgi:NAD-dependent dihydropyrimidine dehydrogenase PreA subunit